MIQLRPNIKVKIDYMSADNICCTFLLWGMFYFAIMLLSINGPAQYIPDNIQETICDPLSKSFLNRTSDETQIRCTLCKNFDPNIVPTFELQLNVHLNITGFYMHQIKIKAPQHEKKSKLSEISDVKSLPYHLTLLTGKKHVDFSKCKNLNQLNITGHPYIDKENQEIEEFGLKVMENDEEGDFELVCQQNSLDHAKIECSTGPFIEFVTEDNSEFVFFIQIDSGKATNGIEKAFFQAIYKNARFFRVTLLFENLRYSSP